jgi:hypothetical protein
MATGLTVSSAAASGESTTAVLTSPLSGTATTFTWSYDFHENGGHELSNIAISFCSTDILSHVVSASPAGKTFLVGDVPGGHKGFGPGVKFGTTAVSGTLTVVFDQPYPAAGIMSIQSHSGDGHIGDLVTTAGGPGTCAQQGTTTTVAPTTTTVPVTTTTVAATTTTTVPVTTTTAPAVTTTTQQATTTTAPATTSTSVPTSVLGARFTADDPSPSLVKTGFSSGPLLWVGMTVLLLGVVLLAGSKLHPER